MATIRDLYDDDIVTRPDWNDGKPVRVTRVGDNGIRYQDVSAHGRARQVCVDPDSQVTVKACGRGGR